MPIRPYPSLASSVLAESAMRMAAHRLRANVRL